MGKPCWRVKTDPSSSILKAQLLVQASILSGCRHGHPGHAYNVIHHQHCPLALALPSPFFVPQSQEGDCCCSE